MKNKKQPANTITAEIQAYQDAKKSINPPAALKEDAADAFDEIIKARPYSDWNEVEIRLAANTARQLSMILDFHNQIALEGALIGDLGKEKINPKIQALEMMNRSVLATLRHLGVSAVQRGSGRASSLNQTKLEAIARMNSMSFEDDEDSLLA